MYAISRLLYFGTNDDDDDANDDDDDDDINTNFRATNIQPVLQVPNKDIVTSAELSTQSESLRSLM